MSIKSKVSTLVVLTVMAFAAGSQAAPATPATPDADVQSTKITIADLATGDDAAAKQLLRRIRGAANDVCADEFNQLECIRDTIARAVATLDNPAVTALYSGRAEAAPVLAAANH